MIDSIQTFGDSFLFGSDLSDSDNKTVYSHKTWPALISKDLSMRYNSFAVGGRGNYSIFSRVLHNASVNSLNIINWTWINRFDYNMEDTHPSTVRPDGNKNSDLFYKYFHTDFDDKLRSLMAIYSTISYLREYQIPFICTYMDKLLFEKEKYNLSVVSKLQNLIRKELRLFPNNQTFLEWSRKNDYPESDNCHPLEQAHEEAAKYWQPIYEKAINTHIT